MYRQTNRRTFRPNSSSRFSQGGRPNIGRSRFGGGRRRFEPKKIDSSMYVRKAKEAVVSEEMVELALFGTLALQPIIQQSIEKKGYKNPTPIQTKAIPPILEGKDVIGIANTGTGKTGAFVLPLIQKILNNRDERVLILVPTRELGMQIQNEIAEFGYGMQIYSTLCIGGRYIRNQIYDLRRDPHFIIATPGRLKDLINQRAVRLDKTHTVVLDEADRMVDMGFIQDITEILSLLPTERQSLCFSATMSPQIEVIVNRFMKNPVTISVKTQASTENVDQDIVRIQNGQTKIGILEEMLRKENFQKVLIFSRTKWGSEKLSNHLNSLGFKSTSIHGDKRQRQREQAIALFRESRCNILVATDVAARGIDIPDITHVINFDEPATYDDYVHRIGRAGRGNNKGHALTFV